jgi:hypothetical protein
MSELFIPYTEALQLKKLGFDEPCLATYHKELHTIIPIYAEYTNQDVIKAPLYTQAFKWFRDNYGFNNILIAYCEYAIKKCNKWKYSFGNPVSLPSNWEGEYDSYEETELECLKELIKIVKKQKK